MATKFSAEHTFEDDNSVATITAPNGKSVTVTVPLYTGSDTEMYPDGPYVRGEHVMRNRKNSRVHVNPHYIWKDGNSNNTEWGWSSNPGGSNWDSKNDRPIIDWMDAMLPASVKWDNVYFRIDNWPWSTEEWDKRVKTRHMIYYTVLTDIFFLATFINIMMCLLCMYYAYPVKLVYVITTYISTALVLLMVTDWWIVNSYVKLQLPYRVRVDGTRVNTGISGRGNEGRFGPNGAADPCVTRWKYKRDDENDVPVIEKDADGNPIIEIVIITRNDGNAKALPGGMNVSFDGKKVPVSATLANEYNEEACGVPENDVQKTAQQKEQVERFLKYVDENHIVVFKGSVSDERDTNNSWMITYGCSIHDPLLSGGIFDNLTRRAGSDASKVEVCHWSPSMGLCDLEGVSHELYANHIDIVQGCYDVQRHLMENQE
jgi:hypothetical protein